MLEVAGGCDATGGLHAVGDSQVMAGTRPCPWQAQTPARSTAGRQLIPPFTTCTKQVQDVGCWLQWLLPQLRAAAMLYDSVHSRLSTPPHDRTCMHALQLLLPCHRRHSWRRCRCPARCRCWWRARFSRCGVHQVQWCQHRAATRMHAAACSGCCLAADRESGELPTGRSAPPASCRTLGGA